MQKHLLKDLLWQLRYLHSVCFGSVHYCFRTCSCHTKAATLHSLKSRPRHHNSLLLVCRMSDSMARSCNGRVWLSDDRWHTGLGTHHLLNRCPDETRSLEMCNVRLHLWRALSKNSPPFWNFFFWYYIDWSKGGLYLSINIGYLPFISVSAGTVLESVLN